MLRQSRDFLHPCFSYICDTPLSISRFSIKWEHVRLKPNTLSETTHTTTFWFTQRELWIHTEPRAATSHTHLYAQEAPRSTLTRRLLFKDALICELQGPRVEQRAATAANLSHICLDKHTRPGDSSMSVSGLGITLLDHQAFHLHGPGPASAEFNLISKLVFGY